MVPKVSIVVPIYNVEPYLRQCVDSLRQQTMREIEIILVDDGSPDNCPQMCDQFARKDDRIRVIHQKNGGPSFARNEGMKVAVAKWLMFVDSDDWLENNAVELLYTKAVQCGYDIVCASFYKNYPTKQIQVEIESDAVGEYLVEQSMELLLNASLRFQFVNIPSLRCPWGKIYRKKIIDNKGIYFPEQLKKMEDSIFNLYAIRYSQKIFVMDIPIYHYRIRPQSTSKKLCFNEFELCRRYRAEVHTFIERFQLWEELQEAYYYTGVFAILKTFRSYGVVIHNAQDFRAAVLSIKREAEREEYASAIINSRLESMPDRESQWGLFFLKRYMYKTILLICVIYGKLFPG